ncbi:MAG: type II toxin-antitoxin system Phd/YefM family antitoxin, partial [Phycisphaerales bacterium]
MGTIAAYDAKTKFSELLDRVEAGEEMVITKHGRPVAKLSPIEKRHDPDEIRKAMAQLDELSKSVTLGGLTIKDLINEGRR